ncbi:MAG TPA: L-seryl-tRNA(Sec) selenium transferase [Anaerohalosphaeraceae bacterium]|jgi:L-seryl-tRNA(Ser) seleniumtransferase|nr:L-seryl-tRNA(Sec) selenium transferase [Anaerohalosphaeraceae bacterium]HRT50642.1 L-seryl-tRNA(Sec) selenium transferase [Anaerohalosphaeraceae bacterium]HRT86533.1 L-seryl-tRNA(Sec) selenium transferase [Anaerohalosphaeraceae bacterium]
MTESCQEFFRRIPSVDAVLRQPEVADLIGRFGRRVVIYAVRRAIEQMRHAILSGWKEDADDAILLHILGDTAACVRRLTQRHYRRVINAAGIVLHTNLGRAVLCRQAIEHLAEEMDGYSLLQVDLEEGKRSRRDGHIEELLQLLTGAEAATVVNNNAAATAIVLNTVAKDREVIVSRGQLVEIGGAFRLPEVMAFSGAKLVEVGTTNKTHARDYENAITENTAALLRVHPSNYKIQGFTSEVPLDVMVDIARRHNLVMIDDVGAGSLVDLSKYGFEPEPTLAQSIAAGSDIVTCSADKLIGAAQGGIILGRAAWIDAIRRNQFARIVRVGKLTLAVLEETLKLFLDETTALREVPTLQMLLRPAKDITRQAKRIAARLNRADIQADVATMPGFSETGSGSLPTQNMPTTLVTIKPRRMTADTLAVRLRNRQIPIFSRIQKDQVLLDPRTLRNDDEKLLTEALIDILQS